MNSPCYRCPDHCVGCHGKCGGYLIFLERNQKIRKIKMKKNIVTGFCIEQGAKTAHKKPKEI